MRFEELVNVSQQVAGTRSRKRKVELLQGTFVHMSDQELVVATHFLGGKLTQGKIGIGPSLIRAALSSLPMTSDATDAGRADNQPLTLIDVDQAVGRLADIRGAGSTAQRKTTLTSLLESLSDGGREFLCRILLGEVRQGALEGVLVEAIAASYQVSLAAVRRGLMLTGDLSAVAVRAKTEGDSGLDRFSLQLFRPVLPMLADTAEDVIDALNTLNEASFEYKLDGVRLQIHKDGDEVRIFTRHLNEVTSLVPEVEETVRSLRARRCILDGEVLAFSQTGFAAKARPLPFQETMRRFGRKSDIKKLRQELPLTVTLFDCLLVDEQVLIDESTAERHQALTSIASESLCVPRVTTADQSVAVRFFQSAIEAGHEGLMAKSPEAEYTAGGRGQHWLKIKPVHTLDLVILGAEWGSGRRRGWLSNLHLGARVGDRPGEFAMIGKTFKGLTDEMLSWQTQELLKREIESDGAVVHVRPELVVEIAFNEVQKSPHYASGFALRFARVKSYRTDKLANDADTLESVRKIFLAARN